jgi:4-amino-4-deoxy-L-arabinose transferase-like glycosyltransferase
MLIVTWDRWTHPIIDHGREMNVPARILAGERLYVDIMYYYGPFAAYFNALLYWLFGTHLNTLHASGIVCAALVLMMIHWIGRRLMRPWASALAASLVLVTCAIEVNFGNYVQPYSYAALYGWTFAMGTLVCALQYLRTNAEIGMLVGGLLAAGAIVSKPELALLAVAPAGVAWAIRSFGAQRWRLRPLLLLMVPALAIGGGVYGAILYFVPWQLVTDTYRALRQPQIIYFTHFLDGTLEWPRAAWALLAGTGVLACLAGGCALFGLGSDPAGSMFRGPRARAVWLLTLVGAAASWYGSSRTPAYIDITPLKSAPVVLASIVFVTAWHAYREKERAALSIQEESLLVIAVFSGIAIVRTILNVSFFQAYTPFTIPTVLIIYVWLLVDRLPNFCLPRTYRAWRRITPRW